MRYSVITPPAVPAVSLEEMKAHLRVDHTDDDEQIADLITSAQAGFESSDIGVLGRPVAYQEVEIEAEHGDGFPMRLFGPINTDLPVVIVYRNSENADVAISPSVYRIDRADTFAPRLLAYSGWPYGYGVRIECFVGLDADDPRLGNFKSAIKLQVQIIYDGVEDLDRYQATIDSLLSPYRVMSL